MPSSAKWGLTAIATAVLSLILLGLSAGLHAHILAFLAVACLLTAAVFMRVGTLKSRSGNRR